jgi:sulfotransferase
MNIKNINFLCGLPRSGSTLLATLLNQHPKIYASPHSGLLGGLYDMHQSFINSESVKWQLRTAFYQQALWTMPQNFYSTVKEDVIFDKQFGWSIPDNFELALKISTHPRFIVCHRPILEVLASFVSKSANNPDFFLNKELESSGFYAKHYLSKNDAMAEYLMYGHDLIPRSILGLANAKKNQDSGMFKFVSYDDLVTNPVKEMSSIFDFLGLEPCELEVDNMEQAFHYNDSVTLGIEDFHKVRPTVKKESPKPEDYFSDFILEKYANALEPIGF